MLTIYWMLSLTTISLLFIFDEINDIFLFRLIFFAIDRYWYEIAGPPYNVSTSNYFIKKKSCYYCCVKMTWVHRNMNSLVISTSEKQAKRVCLHLSVAKE